MFGVTLTFMKSETRDTLARNVHALMEDRGIKQSGFGKRLSQKTISNVLNSESGVSPTLRSIESVAGFFDVAPNVLLVHHGSNPVDEMRQLTALLDNYTTSTEEGRRHIQTIAARESEYAVVDARESGNYPQLGSKDAQT